MPDPDPTPTPAPDPTPDQTPDPKPDPKPEFLPPRNQDEFDRMVSDRLKRERAKFEGYDDLKAKAAKYDELEERNKTELQKANDRAEKAERDAQGREERANKTLVDAAIIAQATKVGVDPDIAIAMVDRTGVTVEDGTTGGVAEAMEALLEAKPHLAVKPGGTRGDADQGARPGGENQLPRDALKNMTPAEIVAARKAGRLAHVMSGS